MNKVEITGRLTKDVDVRANGDSKVARLTVACDRKLTKEQRQKEGVQTADFISVVAFGKSAEFLEKYFKKGSAIEVTGRIQTGSYTNKDGVKIYTTDVVAEDIGFGVGAKASSGNGNAEGGNNAAQTSAPADEDGFLDIPDGLDEELPFN
ncbi:MAG: single-stranded DNA-binding protein [Butyrivibrio sp.]|uniref:single-stranded DNA-binding protein n=1 Tax=Butyrivibrio sp. TaxID=28121 RepID=UPI001B3E4D92|nr:single-stranded DNA-binding protein [Butyrivibrio sp.]MBP3784499.1 single-stranded DNA-binding protein [Butyrivibrio sp.]